MKLRGKCAGRMSLLQAHPRIGQAIKNVFKSPYAKRMPPGRRPKQWSWSVLRKHLAKKGFVTRDYTDADGKKIAGGGLLARSALERLLKDMDKRKM